MSKLNAITDQETARKILVLDGHNIIFRNLLPAWNTDKADPDMNFGYWKYLIIKHIFERIIEEKPDRVVFALDEKNTWRKEFSKEYKAQRAGNRAKSDVDFAAFFPKMQEFFTDFQNTFQNILFLKVDRCEGDDLIAVITELETKRKNYVTSVSTDQDLNQLFKYKTYNQWNPQTKKYFSVSDPKLLLQIKIITGDKSDNISGIKSGIGPGKALKLLNGEFVENKIKFDGLHSFIKYNNLEEKYEHNKLIIDFEYIPNDIRESIITAYEAFSPVYLNRSIPQFFIKHKQRFFLENFSNYSSILSKLN